MTDTTRTQFPTALHEGAGLTRELIDLVLRLDVDTPVAAELVTRLSELVEVVRPHAREPHEMILAPGQAPERYHDRSPVTGELNPVAPPLGFEIRPDGSATTTARLGLAYQGPPGRVHGGFVATLLDHLMGCAAGEAAETWIFTRTLTVDYDLGVPLFDELTISARVEQVDGRKIWVVGEITCDGEVKARARGLWVSPRDAVPRAKRG